MATDAPTAPIVMLDEIDSTNAEAMRRAAVGERGPLWICARSQLLGRGRSGRSWGSPKGSLAASLLFRPGCPSSDLPGLSLVAGIAVVDAIARLASEQGKPDFAIRLKWPNDVLVDSAKLSGILIESSSFGAELIAVVGIGINIASRPAIDGRAIASLAEHLISTDADDLASRLAAAMARALELWRQGAGFDAVRHAWLDRSLALGTSISVNTGAGGAAGTFAGLDTDGALLLEDLTGSRRRFTFGDVTLAAPAKA